MKNLDAAQLGEQDALNVAITPRTNCPKNFGTRQLLSKGSRRQANHQGKFWAGPRKRLKLEILKMSDTRAGMTIRETI